jgi:hypothetical protein
MKCRFETCEARQLAQDATGNWVTRKDYRKTTPMNTPDLLPSERVRVASPMSFAGSAERAWRLAAYPHGDGWMAAARAATILGALLVIAVWWALVLCWYAIFGLWLVPYQLLRQGQRRRMANRLRHAELMTAVYRQEAQ